MHDEVSPALSTWGPGIVYSRLMRFRSGADVSLPTLAVECELCESWEMEDETTFFFQLRDGVTWQDIPPVDGRALSADDIVFSYDRQRQDGRPNASLFSVMGGLTAPRPDSLRISLVAPDADFMLSLADGHSKIVAREAVELSGDLRSGPTVGTGPWVLTDTEPDAAHVFEGNLDYFEDSLPYLEQLIIHIIGDDATRNAAFRVGAIDVEQMGPRQWQEYRQKRPDAPFLKAYGPGGLEVALKTSRAPFDDLRLRRALFQAIDPWGAINDIWLGSAHVSVGFPAAEAEWRLPEDELRQYFARSDVSRDLLREAQARLPVAVNIKVGDFGDSYLAHARRIADEMRAVGFEPTLDIVNRRVFGEDVWIGGDFQMFVGPAAPATSPNVYLLPVLHSQGQFNTTAFRDDELDRLIEAQAQEYDSVARTELVQAVQRRVLDNAYRFMPAAQVSIWTWRPRVQDFHPNFAGSEYSHWSRVWVKD